ncbi:kinase-like domain-containing protein [Glomus cerebriforme]|uniref:Kinase-like domain-containing protein n=1 Tax=Glomus cerebriforme TaxID=658196 RepID=A0A397T5N5_9GLOM|nr:kinase-like domain-containing protein [Glomus cerebriforme]
MSNRKLRTIASWFCGKGGTTETSTLVSYQDNQKQEKVEEIISETHDDKDIKVDLCFVLDCTGSMGGYINAAKDCIQQVVEHMERTNPNIKLWIGFCGYRDHCDGDNRLQIFDFTNSHEEFKDYISKKVIADGGGDAPEDVLGGLDAAVKKLNWCHSTRVLLHMGDYPPHGTDFWKLDDSYPNGDPNGLTAESVLNDIKSSGISYYFGKITDNTDEMIRIFQGILGKFLVFDLTSNGNDPEELVAKVFGSICSSITTTVTLNGSMEKSRQRKVLEKDSREPNWNTLPVKTGELMNYRFPRSLVDILDPNYFRIKSNIISRKFSYKHAPKPFASGAEQYAYFGLDVTHDSSKKIVIKERIIKANSFGKCLEAAEASTIASFLSREFNSAIEQVGIDKKVNFLQVQVLRRTAGFSTRYFTVEPKFLDAKFKRFNANSGVIKEYHSTLEAFAHFTYEYTKGYLVVYDLQGIELVDQFLLTDPAIQCTDRYRFGGTNLGKRGIDDNFLVNHKCDSVCQKLGLNIKS